MTEHAEGREVERCYWCILFTDLVGSSRLKAIRGDSYSHDLEERHKALLLQALASINERRPESARAVRTEGDSYIFIFRRPSDAVLFALDAQRRHRESSEPLPSFRVGIHSGEALGVEGLKGFDIRGLQADMTARVMGLADGGQILCSVHVAEAAAHALKDRGAENRPPGLDPEFKSHGPYFLKGREKARGRLEPMEIWEVREKKGAPFRKPRGSGKAWPAPTARQVRLRRTAMFALFLLLSFFYYIGLLESSLIGVGRSMESLLYRRAAASRPASLSDAIVTVGIDAETDESWRVGDAALIRLLSEAGARVIAFDFAFKKRTESDEALARAISDAGNRGTAVVVGFHEAVDGQPAISEPILRAVGDNHGFLCLSEYGGSFARIPVHIGMDEMHGAYEAYEMESLSLSALAAFRGAEAAADFSYGRNQIRIDGDLTIGLYARERVGSAETNKCKTFQPGHVKSDILIDLPSPSDFRREGKRLDYRKLVEGDAPPAPSELSGVAGKIVMVGETTLRESFEFGGRKYYGMEIHAGAIDAMMRGRLYRGAADLIRYGAIALSLFFGALIFRRPRGAAASWGAVLLFPAVLMWVAFYLARVRCILYPPAYEMLAFFAGALFAAYLPAREKR